MTAKSILVLSLAATFLFTAAAPAEAAKDKKRKRGGTPEQFLSRFDRNNDQKLDAEESERVRQALQALKTLDSDKDGTLSESELQAAKVAQKRARKKK